MKDLRISRADQIILKFQDLRKLNLKLKLSDSDI